MAANSITAANAAIADLAVTNAKIANLSVGTGKIADLAVTNAKISNLAVDTLKIAGNAVTLPVSVYSAASVTSVSLSVSIDDAAYSVTVMASTVVINAGGGDGYAYARLMLNGVEQANLRGTVAAFGEIPASFNMKFTGLTGTNTFAVEGYNSDTVKNTGIIVLVVKK